MRKISALALLWLFGFGCAATINTITIRKGSGYQDVHQDNLMLASAITVADIKELQEGELLLVNVLFKNDWHVPKSLYVKILFYDNNGIELEDAWGWKPVIMESNQESWVKFISPKKAIEISKYKIMTRRLGSVKQP